MRMVCLAREDVEQVRVSSDRRSTLDRLVLVVVVAEEDLEVEGAAATELKAAVPVPSFQEEQEV